MVRRVSRAIACGFVMAAATLMVHPGSAAAQQLSDRSVQVLMDYAWTILPTKFTTQTGKVIKVDKSKKSEVVIPVDVGRDIIGVARLSAHAQICNLPNAQTANYRSMMRVEQNKKKWSEQQLLYISQLHLFTILWLTGNVEITSADGESNVAVKNTAKRKKPTCSEAERKKTQERIKAYVESVSKKQ